MCNGVMFPPIKEELERLTEEEFYDILDGLLKRKPKHLNIMTIVADEDEQRSYSYISGRINPLIAGVAMAMLAKIEFKFIINQAIGKAKEEILKI